MRAWPRPLFAPKAAPPARRSPRLAAEALEARDVPASWFNSATGEIQVIATEAADTVVVTGQGGYWNAFLGVFVPGSVQVTVNGVRELSVYAGNVRTLYVDARGGDDTVRNDTGLSATLNGGWGNDRVSSGRGNDVLIGWVGDDVLEGGDGDDVIWAYDGHDVLNGGTGNDRLYGENGNDTLIGWTGNDLLSGWYGDDTLWGYDGNDTMWGTGGTTGCTGRTETTSSTGAPTTTWCRGGSATTC